MARIGAIQFLQIQRESLKVDQGRLRFFDPAPLLAVAALKLTPDGVVGLTDSGEAIIDVHHRQHPRTRNRDDNFISMGFSPHYAAMRARFGDHLTDGIAGENIFVACDAIMTPDALGQALVIETQAGAQVTLEAVIPIPPCEPFSRFAAGHDLAAPEMKATLRYLSDGTRGFYMRIASAGEAVIRPGDVVWTV